MGSKIEWTDETWNPVRGCSRVSEGCRHCYAERMAIRLTSKRGSGRPYDGFVRSTPQGPRWTGKVMLVPQLLEVPLSWRKPRRVFVNSMSDLFHEGLSFQSIDRVFSVMARSPRHTFQILTKRPERAVEYLAPTPAARETAVTNVSLEGLAELTPGFFSPPWPLPNVWIGTSIEDQASADERLPHLLRIPGEVRFLSVEPLLGPVDLHLLDGWGFTKRRGPDWVIVGGESGPGARPCDVEWIRGVVNQCRAAGVPCFVKQLGANPRFGTEAENAQRLDNRKGGDPSEWPADLRVRCYPDPASAAH